MPNAFVRYRGGGGYQQVANYDYVFDSRKFLEQGFYRDSGFAPMAMPAETTAVQASGYDGISFGTGLGYQGLSGNIISASGISPPSLETFVKQPDEVTHTAPRQLDFYDTTLTFCANSDVSATFTASDSSSRTLLTVADTSIFNGKNVVLAGADLPSATFAGQIYVAVAISATTMLLQTAFSSSYVTWGDAGSGTLTVSVIDKIAEFSWRDILGWSNTAPTR